MQGVDIELFSTVSERKAAFVERAIQSLKHIMYRFIENLGKKSCSKLQQFFSALNCRKNPSFEKSPKHNFVEFFCVTTRSWKKLNQNSNLGIECALPKLIFRSENDQATVHSWKF